MWDLIVSVPDHCLSFYFVTMAAILETSENLSAFQGDITKTKHELLKNFLPQYFGRCPFNRITF